MEVNRLYAKLEDVTTSRADILKSIDILTNRIKRPDYLAKAKELASHLRQMILEDESHLKRSVEEIEILPTDERVKEWIFRLRDQATSSPSPLGFDLFIPDDQQETTPARELLLFDDAAVPMLIAALADERPTRLVRRGLSDHPDRVITIGEVSLAILQKTAGRRFYKPDKGEEHYSKRATRAVEEWWAAHQEENH